MIETLVTLAKSGFHGESEVAASVPLVDSTTPLSRKEADSLDKEVEIAGTATLPAPVASTALVA